MLNNLDMKNKFTLICGAIVLCMIVFVITTGFYNTVEKSENKADSERINNLVNGIKDNYTMIINKNLNNEYEEILYYTDNKLELYESSNYDNGVIVYNDKLFCLDSDTMELSLCSNEYDYVKSSFYNYEFIKSLINKCKYQYVSNTSVTCNISLNDFFEKYNEVNNSSYVPVDDNIVVDISYNSSYITKISIDYSNAYNIINGNDDKFLLNMKFSFNKNDFTEIYEHYKDILEG